MKNIILIRHGKVEEKFQNKLYGQLDVNLSLKGLQKSEEAVEILKKLPISKIYSSPLKRCLYPAKLLSSIKKIPLFVKQEIQEINFGDWTGKTFEELMKDPLFWESYKNENIKPPNGESRKEFFLRVKKFIEEFKNEKFSGIAVVFTHAGVIRAFFCQIFKLGIEAFFKVEILPLKGTCFTFYPDNQIVMKGLNLPLEHLSQILEDI
ncbi:hypothetical protein DRN73_02150 [Candidatus Pacearchaeota archaeon]|nr:MAG: hypothetical protein DRN73_02150 [Candidatus Pacearchaeota archaeon]